MHRYRAWRVGVYRQAGLWRGYARRGEFKLRSHGPTAELALARLQAIVDDFAAMAADADEPPFIGRTMELTH